SAKKPQRRSMRARNPRVHAHLRRPEPEPCVKMVSSGTTKRPSPLPTFVEFRAEPVVSPKNPNPAKTRAVMARPIPEGYHTITPSLTVRGAQKVIDFLKKAFNAETTAEPVKRPDGTIMWAELKIGDSRVMLSDANDKMPANQSSLYLYFSDVDAIY